VHRINRQARINHEKATLCRNGHRVPNITRTILTPGPSRPASLGMKVATMTIPRPGAGSSGYGRTDRSQLASWTREETPSLL